MFKLSSTDCLSSNLDDPVNVYFHKNVSKNKESNRKKTVIYTQSVLLAATSNALWHFPSNKIETIFSQNHKA